MYIYVCVCVRVYVYNYPLSIVEIVSFILTDCSFYKD